MKQCLVVFTLVFLCASLFGLEPSQGPSWQAEYYPNVDLSGAPLLTRLETGAELNFDWAGKAPAPGLPNKNFSARFERSLTLSERSICTFIVDADDGARFFIDGKLGIQWWGAEFRTDTRSYTTSLEPGEHKLKLEYYQLSGGSRLKLRVYTRPLSASFKPAALSPSAPKRSWYKGDLHAHSTVSDGKASVADMVKNAEEQGLDFFVLSDHNTNKHWSDPAYVSNKLTLLYGFEWTMNQSMSGTGHANIWSNKTFDFTGFSASLGDFSLDERSSSDVPSAISLSRALSTDDQEILFSINHPLTDTYNWLYPIAISHEADGIEVWNGPRQGDADFKAAQNFYKEFINSGRRPTMLSGTDIHDLAPGNSRAVTWVYAESKSGLDILRALKRGNAFISYSTEGPRILFTARQGKREYMMGDSIDPADLRAPLSFTVSVRGADPKALSKDTSYIAVYKNAEPFKFETFTKADTDFTFMDTAKPGDYYRAELRYLVGSQDPAALALEAGALALSNPIFCPPERFVPLGLETPRTFTRFEGRISLPPSYPELKEDLSVKILVRNSEFLAPLNEAIDFKITKGRRSADFYFNMPIEADGKDYALSYLCWGSGLLRSGYLGHKGIVPFSQGVNDIEGKAVKLFPLDGRLMTGIDIVIPALDGKAERESDEEKARVKARKVLAEIVKPWMSDFEKQLVIYDWISDNVHYFSPERGSKGLESFGEIWNSLIGPISYGVAECSSFSEAFHFMMGEAGVETRKLSAPGHVWNAAKINGLWYYVDATWNWAGYSWLNIPSQVYSYQARQKDAPATSGVFSLTDREYPNRARMAHPRFIRLGGKIELPAGRVAPEGGVEVQVKEESSGASGRFRIAAGQSTAFFLLKADREKAQRGMKLSYRIELEGCAETGYYTKSGQDADAVKAESIAYAPADIIGLNLRVSTSHYSITGQLKLPPGASPFTEDRDVYIDLYAAEAKAISRKLKLPAGATSLDYNLSLNESIDRSELRIRYSINASPFIKSGYWSASGMASFRAKAGLINMEKGRVAGIDLVILEGHRVSGEIIVPKTYLPTVGQGPYKLSAYTLNSGNTKGFSVYENQSQPISAEGRAAFSFLIPKDEVHQLKLMCVDPLGNEYYYKQGNSVLVWEDLETLTVDRPLEGLSFQTLQPPLALQATLPYRIKHIATGDYLVEKSSALQLGKAQGDASLWYLEKDAGNIYRIKNKASGNYIHLEDNKDQAGTGKIETGWSSGKWSLDFSQGPGYRIRNRYRRSNALHALQSGGAVLHKKPPSEGPNAGWSLEPMGGNTP